MFLMFLKKLTFEPSKQFEPTKFLESFIVTWLPCHQSTLLDEIYLTFIWHGDFTVLWQGMRSGTMRSGTRKEVTKRTRRTTPWCSPTTNHSHPETRGRTHSMRYCRKLGVSFKKGMVGKDLDGLMSTNHPRWRSMIGMGATTLLTSYISLFSRLNPYDL